MLTAIREVPRDRFVPPDLRAEAWDNVALPIGSGQTISQPLVVARMCELLELRGDERVLDVGTGSGYHAALLARLSRTSGASSCHPELSEPAAGSLAAAGIENVTLLVGDGARGHPEEAPYDAINVAAAMPRDPAARWRSSSPPAGGSSAPVEPTTSASCCSARTGRHGAPDATSACASSRSSADRAERAGSGRYSRPAFAHGRPSTITTSAVKSLEPRISEEPTP